MCTNTPPSLEQWRSYTGAHASPSAFQAPPSVNVVSHVIRRVTIFTTIPRRFYMKIIAAGTIPWYSAITNVSGQRKIKIPF